MSDERINIAELHFDVWPYGDGWWVERHAVAREPFDATHLHNLNMYIGEPWRFEDVHTAVLRTASAIHRMAFVDSAKAIVHVHEDQRKAPKCGTFDETCGSISAEGVTFRIGGACPVQGYGTVHGHPAYYRARGRGWSLEVYSVGTDPESDDRLSPIWYVKESPYAFPDGGWLHYEESRRNILKAADAFAATR